MTNKKLTPTQRIKQLAAARIESLVTSEGFVKSPPRSRNIIFLNKLTNRRYLIKPTVTHRQTKRPGDTTWRTVGRTSNKERAKQYIQSLEEGVNS